MSDNSVETGGIIEGLGVSHGEASGPAHIVRNPSQLGSVVEGSILVTDMTSPALVPAMKRAAGIVTDEGGMLSHAAIVAREFDIPAVLGTGDATEYLREGQLLAVDGGKGTVRLLETSTPEGANNDG